MSPWLVVLIIGIGTYLTRLSFVGVFGTRALPAWMQRPLKYVGPAVLAALVMPSVVLMDGAYDLAPASNPRFAAALLAGLVAWRFRSVVATILVGMSALWLLEWLL